MNKYTWLTVILVGLTNLISIQPVLAQEKPNDDWMATSKAEIDDEATMTIIPPLADFQTGYQIAPEAQVPPPEGAAPVACYWSAPTSQVPCVSKEGKRVKDSCVIEKTGKACCSQNYLCNVDGTEKVIGKKSKCCDWNASQSCACETDIAPPSGCANNPGGCLFCMAIAEIGHLSDDPRYSQCAACIRQTMDKRIKKSNGQFIDYCHLTTSSFGNNWAYTPFACVCNKPSPAGSGGAKNEKFCDCCSGSAPGVGDYTQGQIDEITRGLALQCPSNMVDGYTTDGSKQRKRVGNGYQDCEEIDIPGCPSPFRFFNCYG